MQPVAEGAADRLRPLLEQRVQGVLLFPNMHHYHLGDEAARPVLDLLEEHRAGVRPLRILVVKLRDLLGLAALRPNYVNLDVIPAANRHRADLLHPALRGGFLRETFAGAQCSNIVTDTSSTNGWTRTWPTTPRSPTSWRGS